MDSKLFTTSGLVFGFLLLSRVTYGNPCLVNSSKVSFVWFSTEIGRIVHDSLVAVWNQMEQERKAPRRNTHVEVRSMADAEYDTVIRDAKVGDVVVSM